MGRTVTLMLRIRTGDGKRKYCNPAYSGKKKDRLQTLCCEIDGKTVFHPEGVYCLRFEVDGKRRWETVGNNPDEALDRLSDREKWLRAMDRGFQPDPAAPAPKSNVLLKDAVQKYLETVTNLKSATTAQSYKFILNQFAQVCTKQYLRQIDKQDLYAFAGWLKERGAADRTVHNKLSDVVTFLRANDIKDVKATFKYVEKKVRAYKESELKAIFAACTDEEWLIFQFFLGTGFREQEVTYACYNDIDFEAKTVAVRERRQLRFQPKDREERVVPVPDALIELLKIRREMRPNDWLIFPTSEGKPEAHFLRILKERAHLAGLNCGHCLNRKGESCKDVPCCELWILHRFRKSFATYHHENGVSPRKIQSWLGHSSLETTLRYLADVELGHSRTRERVNSSFAIFTREETEAQID